MIAPTREQLLEAVEELVAEHDNVSYPHGYGPPPDTGGMAFARLLLAKERKVKERQRC